MKRRLFSTMLCALALLLLMGAGVEPDSSEARLIEKTNIEPKQEEVLTDRIIPGVRLGNEEKKASQAKEKYTEEKYVEEDYNVEVYTEEEKEEIVEFVIEEAPAVDPGFLFDGQPAQASTGRTLVNGVTYVAIAPTVLEFDSNAVVNWDGASRTVSVQTANLNLTAKVGQLYVQANGRYLYAPDGVQMHGDRVMVPLRVLTKAFNANLIWDGVANVIRVQRGNGALVSGDQYYNQDDLFWLSRVIYAESGNQSLEGQLCDCQWG